MLTEHRLLVLRGADEDGGGAYTSMLTQLHRQGARVAESIPAGASRAALGGRTAPAAAPTVQIATPGAVRYVELSNQQPLARLLKWSAQAETAALLVPESAGRFLARRLAQRASCPVWFVPTSQRAGLARLLVPVDFSLPAADSLRVASGLARLGGGHCLALHVYFNDLVLARAGHDQLLRQRAHAYLDFTTPIDCLGVRVSPLFEEGARIAATILRTAREQAVDLIVMASRGRGLLGQLLRPSIADQVLRDADVPVLVLKHFGARRALWSLWRESFPDNPCN